MVVTRVHLLIPDPTKAHKLIVNAGCTCMPHIALHSPDLVGDDKDIPSRDSYDEAQESTEDVFPIAVDIILDFLSHKSHPSSPTVPCIGLKLSI